MTQLDTEANSHPTARSSNPVPFVLPLVVYLLIASRYPDMASTYDPELVDPSEADIVGIARDTWWYMGMITTQVVIASGLLLWFRRIYLEHFPFRISPFSVVVGVVGVVLWVGVCRLGLEPRLLESVGWNSTRPSFNPFTLEERAVRIWFFAIRFCLLALIVPLIEELFLRGWLVRWIENPNWENVSLKGLSTGALLTASFYGVVSHPSEAIAAFLWFGLVTWLMNRTGNLWDCVVAHGVTNLLLGIYVVKFEQWHLW